jgi:hypothetical protein
MITVLRTHHENVHFYGTHSVGPQRPVVVGVELGQLAVDAAGSDTAGQ